MPIHWGAPAAPPSPAVPEQEQAEAGDRGERGDGRDDNPVTPNLRNWRPGTSGNPKGQEPGTHNFASALRRELKRADRRSVTQLEKIAQKVVKLALTGDMDAIRWIADRTDGKVAQSIQVDSQHTVQVVPWLPAVASALGDGGDGSDQADQTPELVGAELSTDVELE